MKLEEVYPIIQDVPHMTTDQGKTIYDLILENDIAEVLELGVAHGTGSCYMAAALDEKGGGSITTIDNQTALDRKPNVFELTKACDLEKYVTPIFANSSYNWELMKLIDENTIDGICEPLYDFCFLDGAHNFEIDCCAFFLVDKLLKPGGIILFDDLLWTYGSSPSLKNTEFVKNMAEDERTVPHIKRLVDLVVLNHPNYHQASATNEWFMIRKRDDKNTGTTSTNSYELKTSISQDIKSILKKLMLR